MALQDVQADEDEYKKTQAAERAKQAKMKKVQENVDKAREQNARRKLDKVRYFSSLRYASVNSQRHARSKAASGTQESRRATGSLLTRALRHLLKRARRSLKHQSVSVVLSVVVPVEEAVAEVAEEV